MVTQVSVQTQDAKLGHPGSEHTLEGVGQSFAVTRERIRQIEAKALRKLRAFLDGVRD